MKYIFFTTFCILAFSAQGQQRWYVNQAAAGADNGQTWGNAFRDLHRGLAAAKAGDSVWVAQGTYPTDAGGGDRKRSFVLGSGVCLLGGFTGTETHAGQRDWQNRRCVLSGDIGRPGDSTDNAYTVLYMVNPDSGTVLDGFVLERGNADYSGMDLPARVPEKCGGALFIMALDGWAYADVRNCVFQDNFAFVHGGAVFVSGAGLGSVAPRFWGCTFRRNRANLDGGAVYRDGSSWVERAGDFRRCVFEDNVAGRSGGGLYWSDKERSDRLELEHCAFTRNWAKSLVGGGVCYAIGRKASTGLRIFGCRYIENQAEQGSAHGTWPSPIIEDSTTFEVDSCYFKGIDALNRTNQVLLGSYLGNSCVSYSVFESISLFIEFGFNSIKYSSFFYNNKYKLLSISAGKHISLINNILISNFDISTHGFSCDFLQNIFSAKGEIQISITDKSRPAVFSNNFLLYKRFEGPTNTLDPPRTKAVNSIFIETGGHLDPGPKYRSFQYENCYFGGITCDSVKYCVGNILTDLPLHLRDSAGGDFRPLPWSPLVDAGNNAAAAGLATDFEGKPRLQNGTIDIGPFELGAFRADLEVSKAPCGVSATGSVSGNMANGCPPYRFEWTSAQGTMGQGNTGLLAGAYVFTISDACGRAAIDTLAIAPAEPLVLTLNATPVACGGSLGGSAQVLPTNGTPPFQYRWADDPSNDTDRRTRLRAGEYRVTATDALGCEGYATAQVALSGTLGLLLGGRPISCFGDTDGRLSVTPLNGQTPFRYAWDGGQSDSLLQNLGPGRYTATVTDAFGCTAAHIFELRAPDSLRIRLSGTQASTATAADGAATVSGVLGGTAPYGYLWNTGSTAQQLQGLLPGTYTATVTDQRGCTAVQSIVVSYVSDTDNPTGRAALLLYPNPALDFATLSASLPKAAVSLRLHLYDAGGRLAQTFELPAGAAAGQSVALSLGGLSAGQYRAVLMGGSGEIWGTGVLIKL